jgi:hypothetical protein
VTEDAAPAPFSLVEMPAIVVGAPGDNFFAGVFLTHEEGQYPMSLDRCSFDRGRSWIVGNWPGQADLEDLSNNVLSPRRLSDYCCPGNWLLRAVTRFGPASCRAGDVDGDGFVGPRDLEALLGAWGACPDPPASCPADLDGDGAVGITDLLIQLGAWD